jgi:hypothetical protein
VPTPKAKLNRVVLILFSLPQIRVCRLVHASSAA